jgi:hypothetical protein
MFSLKKIFYRKLLKNRLKIYLSSENFTGF